MDNRDEVREFLTSRRAKITPAQAGLPSGPRRRVPGLRRSEVAARADVSVEYCAKPERGNPPLTWEALAMAAEPGLTLTLCTAGPGSPSAAGLNLLASWAVPQDTAAASSLRSPATPPN